MRLGFRVSGRDVLFRVEILIIDLKIITSSIRALCE